MTAANPTQAKQTDSPFGLTFSVNLDMALANGPAAIEQAFVNAAAVGRSISFFWDWSHESELPALIEHVAEAKARGFDVIINMAVNASPGITAPPGYTPTFGNAAAADKYVADVALLASLHPTDLNVYAEVNLLAKFSPDEFALYKPVYQRAYDAAKAADPHVLVGASFLDVLWMGYQQQALPDTLGKRDFIGITSYPSDRFESVQAMPTDWYSRWRTTYPTDNLLLTEVGWDTSKPGSDVTQAAFIQALPKLLEYARPAVVAYALEYDGSFFSTDDLITSQSGFYADTVGVEAGQLYDEFNHVGLFYVDGSPKPAWQAAMDLAFNFKPYQAPGLASDNQTSGSLLTMPVPAVVPLAPGLPEAPTATSQPLVYRFFDTVHGTQFLTANLSEMQLLQATRSDLVFEGVGLNAVDPIADAAVASVYRFFDTRFGTHFYTSSTTERDAVAAVRADLTYEGVAFQDHTTAQPGDVPVYRFFDSNFGTHFYTVSTTERAAIIATRPDLVSEGVAFYAPSAT